MSFTEHLGGIKQRHSVLYWPDTPPVALWKWCARNTKRPNGERGCISVVDWRKLAVWKNARKPGESHEDFTRRALVEFAAFQVAARRAVKLPVPDEVLEMLAAEVGNC